MQKKTVKKKQQKSKKLGIDPTLKPRVVETKSTLTEEEQNENPLNRMKLPKGFKTADQVTEKDDLEFENGKLREMLVSWLDRKVVDGVALQIMVDPLNREVVITREF